MDAKGHQHQRSPSRRRKLAMLWREGFDLSDLDRWLDGVRHGSFRRFYRVQSPFKAMVNPWCCERNGVPWIPSIYPLYVSIYTSTMDPMGLENVQFFEPRCAVFVSTEPKPIFCVRIQDQKWPCQTPWKLSLPAAVKTQDDRKLAEKRTIPGKCQPRINKTLLIRRRK